MCLVLVDSGQLVCRWFDGVARKRAAWDGGTGGQLAIRRREADRPGSLPTMTPADTEMADAARSDLARVVARAQEWAAHDPSESDRARVQELIAAAGQGDESAIGALSEAFAGPLTFGTAGLRGRIGPGESGMNRAVVIRTTA